MRVTYYPTYHACRKANPDAVIVVEAVGRVLLFFTMEDYKIWKGQV